jgi:hypothetical protein
MNTIRKWLQISLRALLLTLVVAAFAIDAARAAQPDGFLRVECGHRYISQAEASRLFGSNNVSHGYARRHTLYLRMARACARRPDAMILLIPNEQVRGRRVRAH